MQANPFQILEQLDPNNLDEYYDLDFVFSDQHISVDLNFDHKTIDVNRLQMVKKFMANIEIFNKVNMDRIKQDYDDDNCEPFAKQFQFWMQYSARIGSIGITPSIQNGMLMKDVCKCETVPETKCMCCSRMTVV